LIGDCNRVAIEPYNEMPPPILNEPILFYSVDPPKVAGFEICVENFTDMGAIIGTAMGGQKGVSEGGIP